MLAVVDRSNPLAWSRTVTVALVTRFPWGSFTVMCRSPVATPWPNPNPLSSSMNAAIETSFRIVIHSSSVGDSEGNGLSELLRQPLVQTYFPEDANGGVLHQRGCESKLNHGGELAQLAGRELIAEIAEVTENTEGFGVRSARPVLPRNPRTLLLRGLHRPGHARSVMCDPESPPP